jgi:hypothetical protein
MLKQFREKYFVSRKLYEEVLKSRDKLIEENLTLHLKDISSWKKPKPVVPVAGFDTTFDEPQEPMARKKYIEDVDYFADAVLNNKLKCAIADIREMLSNVVVVQGLPYNMQRSEYDWYLRGMHDHAWKMYEWMITCQGERRSRLQDKENQQ